MAVEEEAPEPQLDQKQLVTVGLAIVISIGILLVLTVGAYAYSRKRTGSIVLPGGVTYTGPSPTAQPAGGTSPAPATPDKFTAPDTVPWQEQKGAAFPYSFQYPSTLSLVVFPGDPTDAVGIVWKDTPAQNNILVRVEDLKLSDFGKQYIGKAKSEYVGNWWKQYSGGLKGSKDVIIFTNSKGFKGYRTRYINQSDQTPNENVFFEVPGKSNIVVMFANGVLDQKVFDKILDSFAWGK